MLLRSLLTEMCTVFLGTGEVLNIINELTTTPETSTVTDFIRQPCCKKPVDISGNNPHLPTWWYQFVLCSCKQSYFCVSTESEHARQPEFPHLERNIKSLLVRACELGVGTGERAVWCTRSNDTRDVLQKQDLWEISLDFFSFGQFVSLLVPTVVPMWTGRCCHPAHTDPKPFHCNPAWLTSRSCWSLPCQILAASRGRFPKNAS